MAAKNVNTKIWEIQASYDGLCWSAWPDGDKPSGYRTTPQLLKLDVPDGQVSGGLNGHGIPITLGGRALGRSDQLGTAAGARIYLRDPLGDNAWHEAAYYWYLKSNTRIFEKLQVMRLCFEPGNAGSWAAGRALDVKATVNGVDSNVLTGAFVVQPGDFYYLDHDGGDDGTAAVNDPDSPYGDIQVWVSGSAYTGIFATIGPGDTVLCKGTSSAQLGYDGRYCRARHHAGTAPNGSAGAGSMKFINWPTVDGPSVWHFSDPASGKGGFHGANSAYYGTAGMRWIISGFWGECHATSISDSGPIAGQTGAIGWRTSWCECGPWPSTTTGVNDARSGGVSGQFEDAGHYFNHVHDIGHGDTQLQNHGYYLGDTGGGGGKYTINTEIGWNVIERCTGGSSIQTNATSGGAGGFDGIAVHDCFIDGAEKHNLNLSNATLGFRAWNNVMKGAKRNPFRVGTAAAGAEVWLGYNLIIHTESNNATEGNGALSSNEINSGSYTFEFNNIIRAANGGVVGTVFTDMSGSAVHYNQNNWFDMVGGQSAPAGDADALEVDPDFTDFAGGDYTLQATSPLIGAATNASAFAVPNDFYGLDRPTPGTGTPSVGNENTIGATEVVGA